MKDKFDSWISKNRARIIEDLKKFVAIKTVTPNEYLAYDFVKNYFSGIGFIVNKQFLHKDIKKHESFISHPLSVADRTRFNIKAKNRRAVSGKKILFNIHIDVVPAENELFSPVVVDGFIRGRGSCDTKSNLVMLVEAIKFLKNNNIDIKKNIEIDMVIEEEVGGLGTLSSIMHGIKCDFAIVMEPTNLLLYRGHRGCITATIDITGKSVHMGSSETGISAIDKSLFIIKALKKLEKDMIYEASLDNNFNILENPVKINIGQIFGGEWPGSIAEKCKIVANIGFLPNYSIQSIKDKISYVCTHTNDSWTNRHVYLDFNGLRNRAYVIDEKNIYIQQMLQCLNTEGFKQDKTFGWKVSCDAHLYNYLLGVPTIIFGCGDLSDAHSSDEKLDLRELERGILILAEYLSMP